MLALTLLGPPALYRDGRPVALPIRKSLALLTLLARHAAPMPRARISALLWPDLDEPSARRNLRRELARLRESAAGDAVHVDGDSVGLGAAVSVDLDAFATALDEGRIDEALALWHGTLADGFALGDADAFDDWLARERQQLDERRRRALEASGAAHEASGDLHTALHRIDALLADDPLQEQHHRAAMRLLAALGRREAALTRYEQCRTMLHDELGLAPMAETDALAALLRGSAAANDPHPRAPLTTPASPPAADSRSAVEPPRRVDSTPTRLPDRLPFVGRDREADRLEAAWADGAPIVVEGAGGVGKTRLVTDFAAAHGPYAMARCRAGDADVPYAAFTRALRALLGPTPVLPALPGWVVAEVCRLLPDLGEPAAPVRTDDERNRFFEACARAWLALSADDFDAVIVDDWQLADAASRALFGFVARRRVEAGRGGAREIIVLRPELDAQAGDDLRALVAATGATHLQLSTLGEADVFELVRRLSGAGEPARFSQRLARATGGNAFFLAETLRHLAESGLLTVGESGAWQTPFDASTEDYREIPVPASVHEAVLARARRLDAPAQRVLEAASLAAEPFAPSLLAPACALSELDAVMAIESGVAAGLLQEHAAGGYAFAHDLGQQALAGALTSERRRLVHRRLALGAEAAGAPAATIAAHHEASGDAPRAVAHRLAAGDEARRMHALTEAIAQWRKGLAGGPTTTQAVRLHDRIARAAGERTDYATAREHAEAIGRLLDGTDLSADDRIVATIARGLALARSGCDGAAALALLETLPPGLAGRQRFEALWARIVTLFELGRNEQAAEAVRTALDLPGLSDADRAQVLDFAFLCDFNAGRNDAARAHADAALAVARRSGDGLGLARSHFRRGMSSLSANDLAAAATELLAAAAAAARLGLVQLERLALFNLTIAYGSEGRHAEALATAEHCWNLKPPLEKSYFRVVCRLALVDAHFALGDLGACWREAEAAVVEAIDLTQTFVRMGAAICALEPLGLLGEIGLARRLLATIDRDEARVLKAAADELWIASAQFELRHGEPAAAATALAELDAGGDAVVPRVRVRGAQARAEALLVSGDASAALAALPADATLGMNSEMRTRGLALRVAAEATIGAIDPRTLGDAEATLAAPIDHAIARLELPAALARAANHGVAGAPGTALASHARFVAGLAGTLRDHPAQRAAFEAHWSRVPG